MHALASRLFMTVFALASCRAALGGPSGTYTELLGRKLAAWMALPPLDAPPDALALAASASHAPDGFHMDCLTTSGKASETYMGAAQAMRVEAPFETVRDFLLDFGSYAEWIPDLVS